MTFFTLCALLINPKTPDSWASFIFQQRQAMDPIVSQNYPLLSLSKPVRQQVLLWKAIFRHSPLQSPEYLLQEANPLNWAVEAPGRQRQDLSVFKASQGYRVRLFENSNQGCLKKEQLTLHQGARLCMPVFSSSPVLWPLKSPASSSRMPSGS